MWGGKFNLISSHFARVTGALITVISAKCYITKTCILHSELYWNTETVNCVAVSRQAVKEVGINTGCNVLLIAIVIYS